MASYIQRAFNNLLAERKFSLIVISIYAIGLALILYLFTFVKVVFYSTLDIQGGDRLVFIEKQADGNKWCCNTVDPFALDYIEKQQTSFEAIGALRIMKWVNFSHGQNASRPWTAEINSSALQMLNTQPLFGRLIQPSDELPGAENVALLSYDLWQEVFLGAQDAVGKDVIVQGKNYKVIGVMGEGFAFPVQHKLWLPLKKEYATGPMHDWAKNVTVVARYSQDSSIESLNIELDNMAGELRNMFDDYYDGISLAAWPTTRIFFQTEDEMIMVGTLISLFILLLVAFNVGNLLLTRENERIRDTSILRALGARSHQILKQNLSESLLLSLIGLSLALIFAGPVLSVLHANMLSISPFIPFWWDFKLSVGSALLLLFITLLIWFISSLVPALIVNNINFNEVLKSSNKLGVNSSASTFSTFFVYIQIALTATLMSVAFTNIAEFKALVDVDDGIEAADFIAGNVILTGSEYNNRPARLNYIENFKRNLRNHPGVSAATAATYIVGEANLGGRLNFKIADRDVKDFDGKYPVQSVISVDYEYFSVLDIDVISGRMFNKEDTGESDAVVIVSELFAKKWWPGESAIGKQIQLSPENNGEWLTIVGVIPHILQDGPWTPETTVLYRPFSQSLQVDEQVIKVVGKVSENYETASRALIEGAQKTDVNITVDNINTIDKTLSGKLNYMNFMVQTFSVCAILSLLLSSAAIFALKMRSITSRTSELGILRALGCKDAKLINKILIESIIQLSVSLILGLAISVYLKFNVFSDSMLQPSTQWELLLSQLGIYVVVAIILIFVVLLSSYIPTKRVTKKSVYDAIKLVQ